MNKKGNIYWVIMIVFFLLVALLAGLALAFGSVTINWIFDEAVPELSTLGNISASGPNLSEVATYTINPVDNVVQNFTWMSGVIYIFILISLIGLSSMVRITGSKWMMGFFIASLFLLVLASIFVSNIYEEFYTGTDDVAIRLQEHTLLSFLLLYSPLVMSVVAVICGIIMFAGDTGGGFTA